MSNTGDKSRGRMVGSKESILVWDSPEGKVRILLRYNDHPHTECNTHCVDGEHALLLHYHNLDSLEPTFERVKGLIPTFPEKIPGLGWCLFTYIQPAPEMSACDGFPYHVVVTCKPVHDVIYTDEKSVRQLGTPTAIKTAGKLMGWSVETTPGTPTSISGTMRLEDMDHIKPPTR